MERGRNDPLGGVAGAHGRYTHPDDYGRQYSASGQARDTTQSYGQHNNLYSADMENLTSQTQNFQLASQCQTCGALKDLLAQAEAKRNALQAELDRVKKECQGYVAQLQQAEEGRANLADINVQLDQSNEGLRQEKNTLLQELSTINERWQRFLEEQIGSLHAQAMEYIQSLMAQLSEKDLKVQQLEDALQKSRITSVPGVSETSVPGVKEISLPGSKHQISVCSRNAVPGLCGLANLGGSCYMNAALQCLNSAVPFREYFLQECFTGDGLLGRYKELVDVMWRGDTSTVRTDQLAIEVAKICEYFDGKSPQDSQEFLTTILENLHGSLKTKAQDGTAEETSNNSRSIISDLFQGQLRSRLVCGKCQKSTERLDPFMFLLLPVPEDPHLTSDWTLEDSLQNLTKEEYFDEDQWCCPKCNCVASVKRITEVAQAPELLIVYLKRFKINTYGRREKVITRVEYPLSGFELAPNIPESQDVYSLFGVINHSGTLSGGCYTAFAKHGDQWHRFFDTLVTPLKESDVVTSGAYVLFYQRTLRQPGLCGIPNFGNTCYISAAVQCLFSLAKVRECFKICHDAPLQGSIEGAHTTVAAALSKVLYNLQVGRQAPGAYKRNIELLASGFQKFSQQDSHEFIMCLLENISHCEKENHGGGACFQEHGVEPGVESIAELFQGALQSRIKCTSCMKETTREDPFISLSVPVPHQEEVVDLHTCIGMALESPVIVSSNSWHCSVCHASSPPRRTVRILRYPKILMVHLKRFHLNSSGVREKVDKPVTFPHTLELSLFALNTSPIAIYDLTAVINHYGTIASGHYTAFRKHDGNWYQFNDAKVTPIRVEDVVTLNTYLLFYEPVLPAITN